jgi:ubiquitin carboxyl-terminal hydrolase L5
LQAVDFKLDSLDPEWKSMEGGETKKDVITGISTEFGISQKDIEAAELPGSAEDAIGEGDDLLKLIDYRQGVLEQQTMLRSGLRDAMQFPMEGHEVAMLRKHDYGPFLRGWLGALAEQEVLADLLT